MSEREDWINLIRNEYDPKPNLGRASYPAFDAEWDDGSGRIADAILADKILLLRKHAEEIEGLRAQVARRHECNNTPDGTCDICGKVGL